MKPYNERLPLIDVAVEQGLRQEAGDYVFFGKGLECFYYGNSLCSDKQDFICTRDEFNQRKAERQNKPDWADAPEWANWLTQGVSGVWYWWSDKPIAKGSFWMSDVGDNDHPDFKMDRAAKGEVIGNWQDTLEKRPETEDKEQPMKYEYGVEYETNGEKPDLPGDVLVDYLKDGVWNVKRTISDVYWGNKSKFKIVDERYKPKEQDMNDWYEKGELPPVGEACQVNLNRHGSSKAVWGRCKFLGVEDGYVFWLQWNSDNHPFPCQESVDKLNSVFRPLRTETDKLIEQAGDIVPQYTNEVAESARIYTIETLIENGYRKIKLMSEGEFMSKVRTMTDFEMYRAGCRFLDQGE